MARRNYNHSIGHEAECPHCCNVACQFLTDLTCFPCFVLRWALFPGTLSTRGGLHKEWNIAKAKSASAENLCFVCYGYLEVGYPQYSWNWGFRDSHMTAFSRSRDRILGPDNFVSLDRIRQRADGCVFCAVVIEALDPGYQSGLITVQPSLTNLDFRKMDFGYWIQRPGFDPSSSAAKGFPIYMSGQNFDPAFAESQNVNLVQTEHIKLESAKRWLGTCQHEHGETCSRRGWSPILSNPPLLRLIDIERKCIVYSPGVSDYAVLSYVWGGVKSCLINAADGSENIDLKRVLGLEPLGPDETLLPQTILDAVAVTEALGLRYLWVDDLCIRGTDADKNRQFDQMHNIYGNALVTIIAAQAEGAHEGLFGVRPGSRGPEFVPQKVKTICPGKNLVRDMPMPKDISESVWVTRGWCLQEQLLSRRFLVFWDNQVFWQCNTGMDFEDMPLKLKHDFVVPPPMGWHDGDWVPDPHADAPNPPVSARLPEFSSLLGKLDLKNAAGTVASQTTREQGNKTLVIRPQLFQEYIRIISLYCQRTLTNASDSLRAINALLVIISTGLQTTMLYGLPECVLDVALLWRAKAPLQRICANAIPSWSWAGWTGQSMYESVIDDNCENYRPFVVWSTRDKSNAVRLINEIGTGIRVREPRRRPSDWEERKKIPGFYDRHDADIKVSWSPMHIQFWTISCSEILGTASPSWQRRGQGFSLYRIGSQDATGELTLDNDDYPSTWTSQYALIVLSEARFFNSEPMNDNLRLREYPDRFLLYNVLLVDSDLETGTAKRKGVGRILRETWGSFDCEWKYIRLE